MKKIRFTARPTLILETPFPTSVVPAERGKPLDRLSMMD
jgi:hypothetical protein